MLPKIVYIFILLTQAPRFNAIKDPRADLRDVFAISMENYITRYNDGDIYVHNHLQFLEK